MYIKINAASSSCFVPLSSVAQVTMSDQREAETATKEANPIIDGRKANVNLAFLGAKPRNNPTTNGGKNLANIHRCPSNPHPYPLCYTSHFYLVISYTNASKFFVHRRSHQNKICIKLCPFETMPYFCVF